MSNSLPIQELLIREQTKEKNKKQKEISSNDKSSAKLIEILKHVTNKPFIGDKPIQKFDRLYFLLPECIHLKEYCTGTEQFKKFIKEFNEEKYLTEINLLTDNYVTHIYCTTNADRTKFYINLYYKYEYNW